MRCSFLKSLGMILFTYFSVMPCYSLELDSVRFQRHQKVAVYTGSFDPYHLGHHEAVEFALKSGEVDFVVVIPDQEPNDFKPYRTDLAFRLDTVKALYISDPNILTT